MSSSLRYTVDGGILSPTQRKFYEENGFIVLPKLIPDPDLDACRQRFVDICNGKYNTAKVVMEDKFLKEKGQKGEFLINKIQDIFNDELLFECYASHPRIVNVVRSIVGPNITGITSMMINKPPHSTEGYSQHPLHQDLQYFPLRPIDRICASWTALEDVYKENGCLFVIPGSHKGEFYRHDYPDTEKNKFFYGLKGCDDLPRMHLIMEKGDTVFFHPLLIHGSGPNLTKGFRKIISVHYASSNSHFVGFQDNNVKNELEKYLKKKGSKRNIAEYWQAKCRNITGNPTTCQELQSNL